MSQNTAKINPGGPSNSPPVTANLPMESQNGPSAAVDWLTWSLLDVKPTKLDRLFKRIADKFTSTGESVARFRNYEGCELAAYGKIMRDGANVLVDLPAQACEWIRNNCRMSDPQVIAWFLQEGFHATRIDVAIDTIDPATSPLVVQKHWRKKAVTCTAKHGRPHVPKTAPGEEPGAKGWTFYIGEKTSSRFMRVYDKAAEHAAKTGSTHLIHLTRFEMVSRHEHAQKFCELIAAEGRDVIKKVFKGWISFKTLTGRKEVYKRDDVLWWSALVGDTVTYLNADPRIATPEKTLKWLKSTGILRALKLAQTFGYMDAINKEVAKVEIPPITLKQWSTHKHRIEPDGSIAHHKEPYPEGVMNYVEC